MDTKDVYVHVDLSTSYIGGTSASAYMAVALVSLFTEKQMDPNALMTGTLDESGFILPIGQVDKKVKIVAKSKEYDKIVVPDYNCNAATNAALGTSMEVACVMTLSDALNEMLID